MKRILIVDDNPDVRESLTLLLDSGYEIVSVPNGAKALDRLAAQPFDVVLLDLMMPGMSGEEAFLEIRSRGIAVPIAILSAARDVATTATRLGVDAYLRKPLNLDDLEALLRRLTTGGSSSGTSEGPQSESHGSEGGLDIEGSDPHRSESPVAWPSRVVELV